MELNVFYKCVVTMEVVIEHDDPDDWSGIKDKLPGPYDGTLAPDHLYEVIELEITEVEPTAEDE